MEDFDETIQILYSDQNIKVLVFSSVEFSNWGIDEEVTYGFQVINTVPVIAFKFENQDLNFFIHLNLADFSEKPTGWMKEKITCVLELHLREYPDRLIVKIITLSSEDSLLISKCFTQQSIQTSETIEAGIDFIYDNDQQWIYQ